MAGEACVPPRTHERKLLGKERNKMRCAFFFFFFFSSIFLACAKFGLFAFSVDSE